MRSTIVLAAVGILAGTVAWWIARDPNPRSPVAGRASGSQMISDAPLVPTVDELPGFARTQLAGIVMATACPSTAQVAAYGADPWGTPLALTCTRSPDLRIVVISAGPDRAFGTGDDLDARSPGSP